MLNTQNMYNAVICCVICHLRALPTARANDRAPTGQTRHANSCKIARTLSRRITKLNQFLAPRCAARREGGGGGRGRLLARAGHLSVSNYA